MKTVSTRKEDVVHKWFVVDLDGKILGRAASRIAHILRGKHKPTFTPHTDTGDFVVVTNAAKVKLTGKKETKKIYHRHSRWPGSIVSESAAKLRARKPEQMFYLAVRCMLPRGPLGRAMLKKLKVYGGTDHPHSAQKPEILAELY